MWRPGEYELVVDACVDDVEVVAVRLDADDDGAVVDSLSVAHPAESTPSAITIPSKVPT
jgi:hypothetical protein